MCTSFDTHTGRGNIKNVGNSFQHQHSINKGEMGVFPKIPQNCVFRISMGFLRDGDQINPDEQALDYTSFKTHQLCQDQTCNG